ncbi:MAG TPA: phosphopantetheine-binding protein [Coxiellaceae bacterium]|nr:MAG: hypothetical protein A3E81_00880 [Gammaproteobacteria bacterium RIFCSPHIGHO2_12_FULL_36_30]HLB56714.1 phosphopantetheine-binding protein [Coxiellaceae bacterium]
MTTFDQVKQILVERFAVNSALVRPETDLEKELKLDSLDAIDLLIAVNDTFGIHISDKTLEHIHTIADLVAVVEKNKPKKT